MPWLALVLFVLHMPTLFQLDVPFWHIVALFQVPCSFSVPCSFYVPQFCFGRFSFVQAPRALAPHFGLSLAGAMHCCKALSVYKALWALFPALRAAVTAGCPLVSVCLHFDPRVICL